MSGIAITFPGSPAEGQSYLAQNGFTYIYDSQKNRWKRGGDFVRAPKVLSYAGVAVTTTGSGITTGPNGALIYEIPGVVSPSSTAGIDSYKAYRYTDSYPNYTEIQVSISSAFSSVAYAATSTSTTFTIPGATLSGNTTYYLRARQFVGSNASIASTGEISGYSPNVVRFITTSISLDSPTIVSIAGTTGFPVYQIGFAGTTLPATVTYSGSGVGNLEKVEWRVTGPRNPDSTGDTALAEVGIGTFSSATLANSLVLAMPFSGAAGVGITNDVNGAIRSASGASAGTTKTITANGNAGIATVGIATTTAHFYNGAAYFDGNGDYLVTASTSTDFACTGDFTIEMWFSPRATGIDHTLWDQRKTASPPISSWALVATSSNTFTISFGPGPEITLTGTTKFTTGQWYHLTVCRKSNNCSLFINGVLEAFGTNSFSDASAVSPVIGGRYNAGSGGADWTNGYIQDVRYYKGLAKYTENFTPPLPSYGTISYTTSTIGSVGIATTAFLKSTGDIPTAEVAIGSSTAAQVASSLVLAMPLNKTFGFQDINVAVRGLTSGASAGTAKTVGLGTTSTANAPTHPFISATESKWYDGAAYFDGGDYVDLIPGGSSSEPLDSWMLSSGSKTGTFECLVYPTAINQSPSNDYTHTSIYNRGTTYINWGIRPGGTVRFYWYQGGETFVDSTVTIPLNQWSHIAVTIDGTTLRQWINGVSAGSVSYSFVTQDIGSNAAVRTIGIAFGNAGTNFSGYIQDFRIYNGLAKYTTNFTPPRPICGFTTDLAIQSGFTTTSATGTLLSSVVGLGSTSTLAFGADQTYSGITSITSSSGITTLPDTYAQNLVLALPLANITGVGNSFTNDRNTQIRTASITGAGVTAGTTKTITNTGVTTVSMGSTGKWYGNAAYFNNTYMMITTTGDFNFEDKNFTAELWVCPTQITGDTVFFGDYDYPNNNEFQWHFRFPTSTSLTAYVKDSAGTFHDLNYSPITTNKWTHIALTRRETTISLFVDGNLVDTKTIAGGNLSTSSNNISLGNDAGGNNTAYYGYIQDIKIYKGTAKYTTNFTPPPPMFGDYVRSTPNKIVFTPGSDYVLEARNTATSGIVTSTYSASRQWGTKPEGGIYDPYGANLVLAIPGGAVGGATTTFDVTGQIRFETPTATYVNAGIVTYSNSLGIGTYGNKSVTNVGVAVSTNISKYYGRSMYFLGTGNLNSYLSVADSADFDFQGDWTIQCWVYFTRGIGTQEAIWASNTDFKRPSVFRLVGGKMGYFASSNGSSWDILNGDAGALNGIGSIIVSSNQWNHVVFQRRGTTYTGYINGVVDLNKTIAGTLFNAAEAFTIGRWGVSYSMQGHIQDFIIYNNLAKYTSNFTPPNQIYLT